MIEFGGEEYEHPEFGPVWVPYADIALRNESLTVRCKVLVDSGADMTLIPYQVGRRLGFELAGHKVKTAKGLGDAGVPYVLVHATLILGGEELSVRLGWALVEGLPAVLGRLDVFDRFRVEFDQRERVLRFVSKQ